MTDLTQIRARLNTSHKLGSIDSRDDDIATLLREVERLEADARRWRWVREHGPRCLLLHRGVVKWVADEAADARADQSIAALHGREVSGGG